MSDKSDQTIKDMDEALLSSDNSTEEIDESVPRTPQKPARGSRSRSFNDKCKTAPNRPKHKKRLNAMENGPRFSSRPDPNGEFSTPTNDSHVLFLISYLMFP